MGPIIKGNKIFNCEKAIHIEEKKSFSLFNDLNLRKLFGLD